MMDDQPKLRTKMKNLFTLDDLTVSEIHELLDLSGRGHVGKEQLGGVNAPALLLENVLAQIGAVGADVPEEREAARARDAVASRLLARLAPRRARDAVALPNLPEIIPVAQHAPP